MPSETEYYPHIARFLKDDFNCFATGLSTGCGHVGRADVIGVRDVGGETMPHVEIIAVEVKTDTGNFCKNLGQALGYSLFANKCYLAVPVGKDEGFTLEEREMATHLGVGLLDCSRKHISEIATSSSHNPIPSLWTRVLWRLDYIVCCICRNVVCLEGVSDTKMMNRVKDEGRQLYISHYLSDNGKPRQLLFTESSKSGKHRPKYSNVCTECLEGLELL